MDQTMKMPYAVHPVDKVDSSADRAYLTVKRSIVELRLNPGELFTEKEIAEELGVSKTPVREGLVRLQREGLVVALPRAGYRVTPVTLKDSRDLYDFRQLLECQAAALAAAAGLDTPALERLGELADRLTAPHPPVQGATLDSFLRDNFEFDAIIANHCGNRRLTEAIVQVFDDLERVARVAMPFMSWEATAAPLQRKKIFVAIKERDPDAAYASMHERTSTSREENLRALMASPAIENANIPGAP